MQMRYERLYKVPLRGGLKERVVIVPCADEWNAGGCRTPKGAVSPKKNCTTKKLSFRASAHTGVGISIVFEAAHL